MNEQADGSAFDVETEARLQAVEHLLAMLWGMRLSDVSVSDAAAVRNTLRNLLKGVYAADPIDAQLERLVGIIEGFEQTFRSQRLKTP